MVAETPRLGIAVVHHGDPAPTLACLESILRDPSPVERRVVVVDNSAGSGGSLEAEPLPAGVTRLPCPDNPGFGGGANRGVEHLCREQEADAWVVLNHDVELLPGFLAAAAKTLAAAVGPGTVVGAAGGPLHLDRPGGPVWSAGGEVRRLTGTVFQSRSARDATRARDVGFLPGAALAVSAEAWKRVGGFDPAFFLYHEDVDLCLRLRRAGYRLRFVPGMRAVHHLGRATRSRQASPFYLEHLTRTRLRPFRPRLYRLYLAGLHTLYVALRALGFWLRGGEGGRQRARALLRGHRAALSGLWR